MQVTHLVRAWLAALQMVLEALLLGVLEGVKRVGAGEDMQVVPEQVHQPTPMQSRILISPSRILVLIVPSATFSSPATCR